MSCAGPHFTARHCKAQPIYTSRSGLCTHSPGRTGRTALATPGLRWLPQGFEKFYLRRFRKSAVLGADDGHAARHEHFNEAEAYADFTLGALNLAAKPYAPNLNPKP